MAYLAEQDQKDLQAFERELAGVVADEYNAFISLAVSIGLSVATKKEKMKAIDRALNRLKTFNKRFIKNYFSPIYGDQFLKGVDVIKSVLEDVTEKEIEGGTVDEKKVYKSVSEKVNKIKKLNKYQKLESESLSERLQLDLDQKAEQYANSANQLIIKKELQEIREDDLGYSDGFEKKTVNGNRLKKDISFTDSKGRRITTDAIMALVVGDAIWRSSFSARNAAWLASGVKYGIHKSIIDQKTTAICKSLNGEIRDLRKDQLPPLHPNCRSIIEPIILK